MYGLLLPKQCNSPAAKKKKPHPPKSCDDHVTTDDITTMTSDPIARGRNETGVVQLRRQNYLSPDKGGVSQREGERRREGKRRREGEREGEGRRKGRERREGGRRNRQSVVVGDDENGGGAEVKVTSCTVDCTLLLHYMYNVHVHVCTV